MKITILSHYINSNTPHYNNNGAVRLSEQKATAMGDSCNLLEIGITTHTSTHIDLPYHFIPDGKVVSDYSPLEWTFKDVLIKELDIKSGGIIDELSLKDIDRNCDIDFLIIKSGLEKYRGEDTYIEESPVVKASLADFLKNRLPALRAIGLDFISLSSLKNREEGACTHRRFLNNGILIVEDMKLSVLNSRPDFILISPLLIDRADGAPATIWGFYNDFDMRLYDYLFFDFDGVILDTVDIKTQAFRQMYRRHGQEIAEKVVRHHKANGGMSRYDKFKLYHKEFLGIELTSTEIEKLAGSFSHIVFNKVLKAKFLKGAFEFLKLCANVKKSCFLISATPDDEVKKIVRNKKLETYFVDIKGSPGKKEDNLKTLLKTHGTDRTRAVFFGDAVNDLKAANLAGVKFIGINYPETEIWHNDFTWLLKRSKDALSRK